MTTEIKTKYGAMIERVQLQGKTELAECLAEERDEKIAATAAVRQAWETLRDAIHAHDECPDWETCSMAKLNRAESRQVDAIRWLQNIGAYLDILE